MKHLSLIALLFCAGIAFGQESSSKKEKKYQRYENGELVEDKYYLERDGKRVAGEDFEMPEMDKKMAEMEKRMNEIQRDMDLRMKSQMESINKRMEEIQKRSRKMQEDMLRRMESTPSAPFESSPAPSSPTKFPMRGA